LVGLEFELRASYFAFDKGRPSHRPGCPGTRDPPASQAAGITDVHHHAEDHQTLQVPSHVHS
jgi:hypothetical protein